MNVRRASADDAPRLTPLFVAYNAFYRVGVDPAMGERYLRDRIDARDAVVFLAEDAAGDPLGFTLLYPRWRSTAMRRGGRAGRRRGR